MNEAYSDEQGESRDSTHPSWMRRVANRARAHHRRRPSGREQSREDVLRDWYGEDRAIEEVSHLRGDFVTVGEIAEKLLADVGPPESSMLTELRELWSELVGADCAGQCRPVALTDGVLTVEVDSAPWLFVLERQQKPLVLRKVRTLTKEAVADLRFIITGRYA